MAVLCAAVPAQLAAHVHAASTLPLTVLATFLIIRLFGESINLMSMGGLAMAIGWIIDDAVVVVENIHRRLTGGGGSGGRGRHAGSWRRSSVRHHRRRVWPAGLLSGVVGHSSAHC
jgi:Cu/Ag efflux pump CusA